MRRICAECAEFEVPEEWLGGDARLRREPDDEEDEEDDERKKEEDDEENDDAETDDGYSE